MEIIVCVGWVMKVLGYVCGFFDFVVFYFFGLGIVFDIFFCIRVISFWCFKYNYECGKNNMDVGWLYFLKKNICLFWLKKWNKKEFLKDMCSLRKLKVREIEFDEISCKK